MLDSYQNHRNRSGSQAIVKTPKNMNGIVQRDYCLQLCLGYLWMFLEIHHDLHVSLKIA